MQKLLFILAILSFSFSHVQGQTEAPQNANSADVLIEINSETSREDLALIQKTLEPQGIFFRYDNIEWMDGALTSIRMAVKCQDGTMKVSEVVNVTAEMPARFGVSTVEGKPQVCFGADCD